MQRTGVSEPDLTTAQSTPAWNSGLPPGLTVDELRHYRRKRAQGPEDHLKLLEGNFRNIKTEYKRRFKDYYLQETLKALHYDYKDLSPVRWHKPEDNFVVDESDAGEFGPDGYESFIPPSTSEQDSVDNPPTRRTTSTKRQMEQEFDKSFRRYLSEHHAKYVQHPDYHRTLPLRRSTLLKLEGDLSLSTENAEQFVEYLLTRRRSLIKKPPTLRTNPEGSMEKRTETRDKFISYEQQPRPPLYKKFTNLHLEGERDMETESGRQFIEHGLESRPPLVKRATNLRLEGDLSLKPEYRQAFVEHRSERSSPSFPRHNLKVDGFFDSITENRSQYLEHKIHPPIPFLRGGTGSTGRNRKLLLGNDNDDKSYAGGEYRTQFVPFNADKCAPVKRESSLRPEGDFETLTESRRQFVEKNGVRPETHKAAANLQLEGRIDLSPEYRNAYVDFYQSGKFSSPSRRRRASSHLKSEGAMEIDPEYRRSFVDFPRSRPVVRKPETHLSSEGKMDHMTEKRAQYVEYPGHKREDSLRHEEEFKLEGDFVCQPEYRRAYADYLVRERIDRKARPLDNLSVSQKRAFEILPPQNKDKNNNDPQATTSSSSTKAKPSQIPLATKGLSITSTTTTSDEKRESMTTTSGSSKLPRRIPNLSQLETQLFGPKIEPRRSSSSSKLSRRSPSPAIRAAASRSRSLGRKHSMETPRKDRTGSRFSRSIKVEDLAFTPVTSPIATRKLYTSGTRRKSWQRDQGAFTVLEDPNNNSRRFSNKNYDDPKWMSSWNS